MFELTCRLGTGEYMGGESSAWMDNVTGFKVHVISMSSASALLFTRHIFAQFAREYRE